MGLLMTASLILYMSHNCKVKFEELSYDQNHSRGSADRNFLSRNYSPCYCNTSWYTQDFSDLAEHLQYNVSKSRHVRSIPEFFDSRERWPKCQDMMKGIKRQGLCGSCWAFATTYVMSVRLCIQTKGKVKFEFSAQDAIECCRYCGTCGGGLVTRLWKYAKVTGLVSGGGVNSHHGCKPYSKETFQNTMINKCNRECSNTDYPIAYQRDKHFAEESYLFLNREIEDVEAEIMTNGPVGGIMQIFADFDNYKNGIYRHKSDNSRGAHAIVILGWGVEGGEHYWWGANSWGPRWGIKGFFKILKGVNESGVEYYFMGGMMNLADRNDAFSGAPLRFSVFLLLPAWYLVYTNFPLNGIN